MGKLFASTAYNSFENLLKKVEDHLPARSIKTVSKGPTSHFLVAGNSLEVLPLLPDNSIRAIITDPPYNVGLDYGVASDRMKKGEYYAWCKTWLWHCARILGKGGTMYLISYPEINARLLEYIEDELDLKLRRWITWHYPTNIGHSRKNFTRSQRSIIFVTKGSDYTFNRQHIVQHYKNPEVAKIKARIQAGSLGRTTYDLLHWLDLIELDKGMIDVFNINLLKNTSKDRFDMLHPCQLPLSLLRILVKVSSNEGDLIMDPFAGTYSLSAVAAELGRNSLGIEVNPQYMKLGMARMNK